MNWKDNWGNKFGIVAFALFILDFFIGDYLPSTRETRLLIVVILFIIALSKKVEDIDKKLESNIIPPLK